MTVISPSLLAADFAHLGDEIYRIERAGVEYLHLDVMDGHFVPNMSMGPCVIESIRKDSRLFFDVHLMISDPAKYCDSFINAGADGITFHIEAVNDPMPLIRHIRDAGKSPALALSPDTPAEAVFPYLSELDMVLVMTVYPGFGGQKFMSSMLDKVAAIRAEINRLGLSCNIECDGGIGAANAASLSKAGCNVFVAGSSVFRAPDISLAVKNLREAANSAI